MNRHLIVILILVASALLAAAYDLKFRRIPNWLSFSIIPIGIIVHTLQGGFHGFQHSLLGISVGAGLLLVPYLLGGMGAGDLKLLAAQGALVGAKGVIAIFIIAAIFGGLLAIAALVAKKRIKNSSGGLLRMFLGTHPSENTPKLSFARERVMVPYGVAICFGALTLAGLAL